MTALYHTDVAFPNRVILPKKVLLRPDDRGHTEYEAKENYNYIPIDIPDGIMFKSAETVYLVYKDDDGVDVREGHIFEIESRNGTITKVAVRCDYDLFFDIVVAINMKPVTAKSDETQTAEIKTVYLNRKSDTHGTLDESRYDTVAENVVTV